MTQPANWTAVEAEIDRIISGSTDEPFDANTIANVREFVRFAREHRSVPEIGKGYWSTICFSWKMPSIQVEVFGDCFEVYRFHDRRTDIKEVRHNPGSPFPQELKSDLPRHSN